MTWITRHRRIFTGCWRAKTIIRWSQIKQKYKNDNSQEYQLPRITHSISNAIDLQIHQLAKNGNVGQHGLSQTTDTTPKLTDSTAIVPANWFLTVQTKSTQQSKPKCKYNHTCTKHVPYDLFKKQYISKNFMLRYPNCTCDTEKRSPPITVTGIQILDTLRNAHGNGIITVQ